MNSFIRGFLVLGIWAGQLPAAVPSLKLEVKGQASVEKQERDISGVERDGLRKKATAQATEVCVKLLTDKAKLAVKDQGLAQERIAAIRSTYRVTVSAELDNPDHLALIPTMVDFLRLDPDENVPENSKIVDAAQILLRQMGDPAAQALLGVVGSTNTDQRQTAFEILVGSLENGILPFFSDTNQKITRQAVANLQDPAGKTIGRWNIQHSAEEFLKEVGVIEEHSLDTLIASVGDDKAALSGRAAGARVLGHRAALLGAKTASAVANLIKTLERDVDESILEEADLRDSVESALASIGEPAFGALLAVLENSKSPETRAAAAMSFAKVSSPDPLPTAALIPMLKMQVGDIQYKAATSVRRSLSRDGEGALGKDTKVIADLLVEVTKQRLTIAGSSAVPWEAAFLALAKMGPSAVHTLPALLDGIQQGRLTSTGQSAFAAFTVFAIAKIARTGAEGKAALPVVRLVEKTVNDWYLASRSGIGPQSAAMTTIALEIMEGTRDPDSD